MYFHIPFDVLPTLIGFLFRQPKTVGTDTILAGRGGTYFSAVSQNAGETSGAFWGALTSLDQQKSAPHEQPWCNEMERGRR
jgi:hypothetical protein